MKEQSQTWEKKTTLTPYRLINTCNCSATTAEQAYISSHALLALVVGWLSVLQPTERKPGQCSVTLYLLDIIL